MSEKIRDNRNCILREGEYQRGDGRYRFHYLDEDGKEKNVYSWCLDKNDPMPKIYLMYADISVTLNTYTHVQFTDVKDELLRVVNE